MAGPSDPAPREAARCRVNGEPVTEFYFHVYPVATLVTTRGTTEVTRIYFANDQFDLGRGKDVAVDVSQGARVLRCDLDLGRGLSLELTEGYKLYLPVTRLSGTYR